LPANRFRDEPAPDSNNQTPSSGTSQVVQRKSIEIAAPKKNYAPLSGVNTAPQANSLSQDSKYFITYEELNFEYELGRGSFGSVHYGTWRMQPVAIKKLLDSNITEKDVSDFQAEAIIYSKIRPHQNVVTFLGFCISPLCIVTEFMSVGSLSAFIKNEDNKVQVETILTWALETAAGMAHLHLEGVVHRDLASRNLLLDNDFHVKIADFGMSRVLSDVNHGDVTKSDVGPLKWMAPECISEKKYSPKSDTYAFSITLIEMLSRGEPYPNVGALGVAIGVIREGLRPEIPEWTPPKLDALMRKCWQPKPEDRPDFKYIYNEIYQIIVESQDQ